MNVLIVHKILEAYKEIANAILDIAPSDVVHYAAVQSDCLASLEARTYHLLILQSEQPNTVLHYLLRKIKYRWPNIKTIVIAENKTLLESKLIFDAGAVAYIDTKYSQPQLSAVIVAASNGLLYHPSVHYDMYSLPNLKQTLDVVVSSLSPRELEVLINCLAGYSLKGMSDKMKVSQNTASTQKRNLYEKTHTKSVAELVLLFHDYDFYQESVKYLYPSENVDA